MNDSNSPHSIDYVHISFSQGDFSVLIGTLYQFHDHRNQIPAKASSTVHDLLKSTICIKPDFMKNIFITH